MISPGWPFGNVLFPVLHIHQPYVGVREGDPDAPHFFQPQDGVGDPQGSGLGKPVPLAEEDPHVLYLLDHLHRHRRRPGIQELQLFGQVQFRRPGVIDDRVDHGRDSGEESDLLEIGQDVHHLVDVEPGDLDLGGAVEHAPVQDHDVPIDMEIGKHGHNVSSLRGRVLGRRAPPQDALKRRRDRRSRG